MRFQRRITIAKGIRLNLSGSGASLSIGPRGASMTVGRRGVHANAGIPGTGLSHRMQIAPGGGRGSRRGTSAPVVASSFALDPDGAVVFLDAEGNALSGRAATASWEVHGNVVSAEIEARVAAHNAESDEIANARCRFQRGARGFDSARQVCDGWLITEPRAEFDWRSR